MRGDSRLGCSAGRSPAALWNSEDAANEDVGELRSPGQPGAAVPTRVLSSKSYEHRFRLQQNPPCFLHAVLDFILQAENIARLRFSPVDQRQSVFVRDSGRSHRV